MQHANFVHLHVHTYYSLLDGAVPIDKLIQKAKEFRLPALAITDHGNLFGAVEFYEAVSKAGIKPIIGCEVYLLSKGSRLERESRQEAPLSHLTLLIKNPTGYKNLCKLISSSYLEGFYYKPRIDKEILRQNSEGLLALSGCLKGEINHTLLSHGIDAALPLVDDMLSIFGPEDFFLEIMDNGMEEQAKIRPLIIELSKQKGVGLVATNDVHYLERSDSLFQDVLLCIQTGKNVSDQNRLKLSGDQFYFRSPDEMSALFSDCPEAISNTVLIAERLNMEFDFKTYHFPKFSPPENYDLSSYLEESAKKGFERVWPLILGVRGKGRAEDVLRKEYEDRLQNELQMIKSMGFAGYFLIVADFINYAKGIKLSVGPGRGSAAGSLVAYSLGITDLDPLEHGLLFERFLNPERISMPDVDIDFCMRRRSEVIDYVTKKYGNVSQIITFGKMKAKAAIRDVGRALGMPYGEVDRIAKLVPTTLNITLGEALEVEPRLKKLCKDDPQVARLIEIARFIEGFPRHASTHAAGVVISDQTLSNFLPLSLGQNDEVVTQYDMKGVEKIGLIKFDFLGLRTLTVIEDCIKIIEERGKGKIEIGKISLCDPLVYEKLSDGDTSGIFQLESSGMTDLIVKLKPNTFADIVALVALFRPGPLGSGMVDDFINRKHGRTSIRYELAELEQILFDTYGVIVYQEQVMQIASKLAGFSLGESDILRRAMGKKKADEMEKQKERFLVGAKQNNIPPRKAEKIFDLMAKFAEYGFNRAHSAAYALVSYRTAYLKFHHPSEYMAALLTSEKDNTDKILNYINDCKEHDIEVLPPDVNQSDLNFTVVDGGLVRFGLGAVKNVGEAAIESILEARRAGPFLGFFDFCSRVDSRKVNKRVIESLIKCGAFDFCKANRSSMLASLDRAMDLAASCQRDRISGQSNLFDLSAPQSLPALELTDVPEWDEHQRLTYEKDSLGFYITGHPLAQYEKLLSTYATADTLKLSELADKSSVRIGGIVSKMREITTKRGDRMAFCTIEDLKGSVETVVFSDLYAKTIHLIKGERPLFLVGQLDSDEESVKIIASEICLLDEVATKYTKSIHFYLRGAEGSNEKLVQLKSVLARYTGNCPSFLHITVDNDVETILRLPDEMRLMASPELMSSVKKLFGHDVVGFSSEAM